MTDNATTFSSGEFQDWCKARGIIHLTGAPYHPATNGAAERLVQTFKQALKKSSLAVKTALQQFLMQYRRTPLAGGYSPSELLNGRQMRAAIDTLFMPCYALYCGPKRERDPQWVPVVVTKVYGARSVNVRVYPKGPTWRRHVEQLCPRYTSEEDNDPGDTPSSAIENSNVDSPNIDLSGPSAAPPETTYVPQSVPAQEFGPHNPRRSARLKARANRTKGTHLPQETSKAVGEVL